MKQDIRKRWVERLRNTSEKQHGQGMLKDMDDRMCCLGVLCEMAVEDGIIPEPKKSGPRYRYGINGFGSLDGPPVESATSLPAAVIDWAGMKTWTYLYGSTTNEDVMILNDVKRYTFKQIADIVEEFDECS